MLAQLGDIKFTSVISPTSQDRSTAAVYAEHALIDGKPRLQRLGDALDKITMVMKFHTSFCDPEEKISQLKNHLLAGDTLEYINGAGDLLGDFLVVSMKETPVQLADSGRYIEVDVEVQLIENFNVDKANDTANAAKDNGFAVAKNTPPLTTIKSQEITPLAIAEVNAIEITAGSSAILAQMKLNENVPSAHPITFADVKNRALVMQRAAQKAIQTVNSTEGNIYDLTRNFEAAMQSTNLDINNLLENINAGDYPAALATSGDLVTSSASVATTSESMNAYKNSRLPN